MEAVTYVNREQKQKHIHYIIEIEPPTLKLSTPHVMLETYRRQCNLAYRCLTSHLFPSSWYIYVRP